MTNYPIWSYSAAELRDLERFGDKLPGETWHAVSDPDEEDAARGEEREYRHTLYGGECD